MTAPTVPSDQHGNPLPGPSKSAANSTWRPSRYLEPLHPDNEEVLEQAAYQAAVTRSSGDDRKRKIKPRRTVDYQGGVQKWRMVRRLSVASACRLTASAVEQAQGHPRIQTSHTSQPI